MEYISIKNIELNVIGDIMMMIRRIYEGDIKVNIGRRKQRKYEEDTYGKKIYEGDIKLNKRNR